MSSSMLLGMFDWIADFFKALFDLIPKIMYLLYASLACILDVLQLFFRKLAGLDVYYMDGKAVSGDIVTNFIAGIFGIRLNASDGVIFDYSALTTVFWSFIVFGIIVCFASTLIAIIKSHYSYDEKAAKGPMQYVYTALKSLVRIVSIPVIVLLGLYVSQAILTALDSMTSITSGTIDSLFGKDVTQYFETVDTVKTATGVDKNKTQTYIFYDIFGVGGSIKYGNHGVKKDNDAEMLPGEEVANWVGEDIPKLGLVGAMNQTFSGSMFRVAAYNGNRARLGEMDYNEGYFTGGKNARTFAGMTESKFKFFKNAKSQEQLADMIDTLFACNIHIKDGGGDVGRWVWFNYAYSVESVVSLKYFTNFLCMGAWNFSKFNVGAVWYYYDLWNFNFIVGFGSIVVCLSLFLNIILGLITRLFMCIGLFLIYPPLFGLAPLTDKPGKGWTENFMKQVLMAYGAVVGMNIFFLILPYMNEIDFFNIAIADYFAQTLVIIVGLITIKAFISTISGLIGAADANKAGEDIAKDVGKAALAGGMMTMGAAKVGAAGLKATANGIAGTADALGSAFHEAAAKRDLKKEKQVKEKATKQVAEENKKVDRDADRMMDIMNNTKGTAGAVDDAVRKLSQDEKGKSRAEKKKIKEDKEQARKNLERMGYDKRQQELVEKVAKEKGGFGNSDDVAKAFQASIQEHGQKASNIGDRAFNKAQKHRESFVKNNQIKHKLAASSQQAGERTSNSLIAGAKGFGDFASNAWKFGSGGNGLLGVFAEDAKAKKDKVKADAKEKEETKRAKESAEAQARMEQTLKEIKNMLKK